MRWRRWLLIGALGLCGCVNSQALGRLIQPHVEVKDPVAWTCQERVKMPLEQGGIMGGGLTECTRCLNHTAEAQGMLVKNVPVLVAPGDSYYTCDNGRVMVQGVPIEQGSTRR